MYKVKAAFFTLLADHKQHSDKIFADHVPDQTDQIHKELDRTELVYLSCQPTQPKLWLFSMHHRFSGFTGSDFVSSGHWWRAMVLASEPVVENMISAVREAPRWIVVLAPTVGGLFVGAFLQYVHPIKRAEGVADVIEARARGGKGLRFWQALDSAAITIISLGSGAKCRPRRPDCAFGSKHSQINQSKTFVTACRTQNPASLRGCKCCPLPRSTHQSQAFFSPMKSFWATMPSRHLYPLCCLQR